jgi:hypothetical protein
MIVSVEFLTNRLAAPLISGVVNAAGVEKLRFWSCWCTLRADAAHDDGNRQDTAMRFMINKQFSSGVHETQDNNSCDWVECDELNDFKLVPDYVSLFE